MKWDASFVTVIWAALPDIAPGDTAESTVPPTIFQTFQPRPDHIQPLPAWQFGRHQRRGRLPTVRPDVDTAFASAYQKVVWHPTAGQDASSTAGGQQFPRHTPRSGETILFAPSVLT